MFAWGHGLIAMADPEGKIGLVESWMERPHKHTLKELVLSRQTFGKY
jgi:hypothetical protein